MNLAFSFLEELLGVERLMGDVAETPFKATRNGCWRVKSERRFAAWVPLADALFALWSTADSLDTLLCAEELQEVRAE